MGLLKKWWFWVIAILILVFVFGGNSEESTTESDIKEITGSVSISPEDNVLKVGETKEYKIKIDQRDITEKDVELKLANTINAKIKDVDYSSFWGKTTISFEIEALKAGISKIILLDARKNIIKNFDLTFEEKATEEETEKETEEKTTTKEETTQEQTTRATQKQTEAARNGGGETVYVTEKGKKYHCKSNCSGMKNPFEISKEEAIRRGYGQCSKCY